MKLNLTWFCPQNFVSFEILILKKEAVMVTKMTIFGISSYQYFLYYLIFSTKVAFNRF